MTSIAAKQPTSFLSAGNVLLIAGLVAVIYPTMQFVATESWSTEQGAHGPIVLATGLWLLSRLWKHAKPLMEPAPSGPLILAAIILLPLYLFARVTQIIEIEGYLMYALVLMALYSVIGWRAMKFMWFPLFYLLFVFPPPDTIVVAITQPLKILISNAAIWFLYLLGYPIGGAGVTIQIGQYQLLVAAACSGLNSLISLSAISLFYIYVRHQANWRYAVLLGFMIVPVAIIANFIRVLILILLTYHSGEAVAQGFLHNFAGITMFVIAVLTIFAIDSVLEPIWTRYMARKEAS